MGYIDKNGNLKILRGNRGIERDWQDVGGGFNVVRDYNPTTRKVTTRVVNDFSIEFVDSMKRGR